MAPVHVVSVHSISSPAARPWAVGKAGGAWPCPILPPQLLSPPHPLTPPPPPRHTPRVSLGGNRTPPCPGAGTRSDGQENRVWSAPSWWPRARAGVHGACRPGVSGSFPRWPDSRRPVSPSCPRRPALPAGARCSPWLAQFSGDGTGRALARSLANARAGCAPTLSLRLPRAQPPTPTPPSKRAWRLFVHRQRISGRGFCLQGN